MSERDSAMKLRRAPKDRLRVLEHLDSQRGHALTLPFDESVLADYWIERPPMSLDSATRSAIEEFLSQPEDRQMRC